jgi:hypothetical protein
MQADVNQLDEDGEPPAFYADLGGFDEIMALLTQCGSTYEA